MQNRREMLTNLGHLGLFGIAACSCSLSGCRSAPVTGRPQLILVPEGQEIQLGVQAYQETLTTETVSQNQAMTNMVNKVGQRIAEASGRPDYQWEFKLIASETQNAFCLPGGKVAIYEGILPVCQSEGGLAVVMSHEIAHALARHGGERMSHSMASDGVKTLAEKLVGTYAPDKAALLMQAYGVGSKYGVMLPYNRRQESEADRIGLDLMAKAGYDPSAAPAFWNRFGAAKGDQTIEFFSTHPSDDRRARDLLAVMEEATKVYQQAPVKYGQGTSLFS